MIELDTRGRPWADRNLQDAVEKGHGATITDTIKQLRTFLNLPEQHRIIICSSHEEAVSTAINGRVFEKRERALWDIAGPAFMRGSLKSLQHSGWDIEKAHWKLQDGNEFSALQIWNQETGKMHPSASRKGPSNLDLGIALFGNIKPNWNLNNSTWTIPGWSFGGPISSGILITPPEVLIRPIIHGSEQNGYRGGRIDEILLWRLSASINNRERWPDSALRSTALSKLISELELEGANTLTYPTEEMPAAVIHWPGIRANAIAQACKSRGVFFSVADACTSTKNDGSAGWKALGKNEQAYEAILFTPDKIISQEERKKIVKILVQSIGKLRTLK